MITALQAQTSTPGLAAALASVTAVYLLLSVIWLARQHGSYSHVRQTISELGEVGSPVAGKAAWFSFAPVGVLCGLSLLAIRPWLPSDENVTAGLLLFGFVALGYLLAAVFPCDAGAPLVGSWRNQVHNLIGGFEYLGALGGLDLLHRSLEDFSQWSQLGLASQVAFQIVLLGFLGTLWPSPFRGLAQRIGEGAIFGWLAFAGWSVWIG
ncbi:MAG: DUF998 domain-containing protein [Acidobacteriota bacterium]